MTAETSRADSMSQVARSLLLDTSDAALQAVLQQLSSQDHASLRLVSKAVSKRTTERLPCVTLQLTYSSSAEQLQQWVWVTRPFQHVHSIHVHVAGAVSAGLFELAMQLLSQRYHITELHLLARVVSDVDVDRTAAFLPSLQPISALMSHLQTLIIVGIAVRKMADELDQIAAAAPGGGWPLQSLSLDTEWVHFENPELTSYVCLWQAFSDAMMHMQLNSSFPQLQTLAIRIPAVGVNDISPAADDLQRDKETDIHNMDATDVLIGDYWSYLSLELEEMNFKAQAASALVAALAALANAVLQMKGLRFLTITGAPDIWRPIQTALGDEGDSSSAADALWLGPAVAIAANLAVQRGGSVTAEAARTSASCRAGQLSSVSAAAAVFSTMDDYGCWLLQHHPGLEQLHVSCAHISRWSMFWRKQQQQHSVASSSSSGALLAGTAAELLVAAVDWHADPLISRPATGPAETTSDYKDNISSSASETLSTAFKQYLSHYSSRPDVYFRRRLNSCKLRLDHWQVAGLADLLGDLKSLKHLEISVEQMPEQHDESWVPNQHAVLATVTGAAVLPRLKSFNVSVGQSFQQLPDDLLLPLTAAGGPGSSLTKLGFSGDFTPERADADADNNEWLRYLKQLTALREFSIKQDRHCRPYNISAATLPPTLQVFRGVNLRINTTGAAAAVGVDDVNGASIVDQHSLQLQSLCLEGCQLTSSNILASDQLTQLTVINSSWSGGWAAATAAWPHVRNLVWMRDNQSVLSGSGNDTSNSSSSSSRLSEEDSSEDSYPWGDEYSDEYDEEQDEFFKVYYKASEEELEEWRVAKAEPIIDKAADVYVANLLADVSTAQKVLHDIPAGFKHLRSLAMGKLPWLRVDVVKATLLQHVVQEIKGLQHFHVGMHGQQQPTFPEQLWHKLKFTDWSTSQAKYADAYKAAISSKLSGTTADFGSYPSVSELQRRLQQQACWAVFCMWIEGY